MNNESVEVENLLTFDEGLLYLAPSDNMVNRDTITNYILAASNEEGKVFLDNPATSILTPKDTSPAAITDPTAAITLNVAGGIISIIIDAKTTYQVVVTNSYVDTNSTIIVNSSIGIPKVSDTSFGSFTVDMYFLAEFTGTLKINFTVLN